MPDILPVDQNGSLAALAQPPLPATPMGPPQDPMQKVMEAMSQLGQQPPAAPSAPLPLQAEPPSPTLQPPPPGIPDVATQPGAGSDPLKTKQQELAQHFDDLRKQKQQVQDQLRALMSPEALVSQLPNGGKSKPSDLLRDALYNFSQLNLRNPTIGVLKGEPYVPIQQQRMQNALQQHTAQVQNLTLLDKSLQEQMVSDQFQQNQTRQEQQERDKVVNQQATQSLGLQKLQATIQQNASKNNVANTLAKARVGLISAQQAKVEMQTEILDNYGGNSANFMNTYVRQHSDDPDFLKNYADLKKTLEPTKSPTGTTVFVPNDQGGYNVMRVDQGSSIPAGARTLASISGDSVLPATTRTMIAAAPSVLELTDRLESLLDKNVKLYGPLASRWNEFVTGKIGAPGADFFATKTVKDLLQTKLAQMHAGSRGSSAIMAHFNNMMDVSMQSPENLRASLAEIRLYAQHVANEKAPNAPTTPTSQPASITPPPVTPAPSTAPKVGDTHQGKKIAKIELIP